MKRWVVGVLAVAAGAVGLLVGLSVHSSITANGSVGRLSTAQLQRPLQRRSQPALVGKLAQQHPAGVPDQPFPVSGDLQGLRLLNAGG